MQQPYQTIKTDIKDGLFTLCQNRPDKLNARNSQMYVEIMAALKEASNNDEVAALVLTSSGKFFSAGMDFSNDTRIAYEVQTWDHPNTATIKTSLPKRDGQDVSTWLPVKFIESFINFDKPLIGAVNGPAIGEGFSSLLHCDLVYAARSAYFWAPFARAGVAPEFCATELLQARLGQSLAAATLYLARRITCEEAHNVGFVVDIIPDSEDFQNGVHSRLREGLQLAGPPDLRARTLQSFKQLAYSTDRRRELIDRCHREFELIGARARSGETARVQAYYREALPDRS